MNVLSGPLLGKSLGKKSRLHLHAMKSTATTMRTSASPARAIMLSISSSRRGSGWLLALGGRRERLRVRARASTGG